MQDARETQTTPRATSVQSVADGVVQSAYQAGTVAKARVEAAAGEIVGEVKERPYVSLALAAGLGFAIGALWKMSTTPRRSVLEQWASQLPASADRLRSYWR